MITLEGLIKSPLDAIYVLEVCRLGRLSMIHRRLHNTERQEFIRSGSIFVWDEGESGIKRWTDNIKWTTSRIQGSFLVYRQHNEAQEPLIKKSISIERAGKRLHLISYYRDSDFTSNRFPTPSQIFWDIKVNFENYPDYNPKTNEFLSPRLMTIKRKSLKDGPEKASEETLVENNEGVSSIAGEAKVEVVAEEGESVETTTLPSPIKQEEEITTTASAHNTNATSPAPASFFQQTTQPETFHHTPPQPQLQRMDHQTYQQPASPMMHQQPTYPTTPQHQYQMYTINTYYNGNNGYPVTYNSPYVSPVSPISPVSPNTPVTQIRSVASSTPSQYAVQQQYQYQHQQANSNNSRHQQFTPYARPSGGSLYKPVQRPLFRSATRPFNRSLVQPFSGQNKQPQYQSATQYQPQPQQHQQMPTNFMGSQQTQQQQPQQQPQHQPQQHFSELSLTVSGVHISNEDSGSVESTPLATRIGQHSPRAPENNGAAAFNGAQLLLSVIESLDNRSA